MIGNKILWLFDWIFVWLATKRSSYCVKYQKIENKIFLQNFTEQGKKLGINYGKVS